MHIHFSQYSFILLWLISSSVNWFFLIGEYNHNFRQKLHHTDGDKWIIAASLCAGINGLLVTLIANKGKHFAWRPISKKEKEQLLMLKMLEDDTQSNYNDFIMTL